MPGTGLVMVDIKLSKYCSLPIKRPQFSQENGNKSRQLYYNVVNAVIEVWTG